MIEIGNGVATAPFTMYTFFHGWRRKAGIAALLLACVLMVGWVRSLSLQDQLITQRADSVHIFTSMNGTLLWSRSSPFVLTAPVRWSSTPFLKSMEDSWRDTEVHWRWQRWGFNFGAGTYTTFGAGAFRQRFELWQVPYWALTIPLAFLSAYLILWKPRKRPTPN